MEAQSKCRGPGHVDTRYSSRLRNSERLLSGDVAIDHNGSGRRVQRNGAAPPLSVDVLRNSFLALKRQAAPGVDDVTWEEYETVQI